MQFDAVGRELRASEQPAVEAFCAKYAAGAPQLQEVTQAEQESPALSKLPPLLPLSAFAEALPDISWQPEQPAATLYLRDTERVVVQEVETSCTNLGYHLWRDEELGKQGIYAHEEDAKAFAEGLVATLAPRLSIFDLEFVVQAFTAELERAEAERQAAIAEHAARQPKT